MEKLGWGSERRRSPRRAVNGMVDLLGRTTVNGTVVDISTSGLRATLPTAMFVGDRRLLRVFEAIGGEQMRWGEVVWSRQTPNGFQVGMRFCRRPRARAF